MEDADSSGLVQEAGHGGSPLEALVLVDSINCATDALIVHYHVSPGCHVQKPLLSSCNVSYVSH